MPRRNLSEFPGRQEPSSMTVEEAPTQVNSEGVELVEHSSHESTSITTPPPPPQATEGTAPPQSSLSPDEVYARALDQQLNRPPGLVMAQPVLQVPFNCGSCGTTHDVQRAAPGSQFQCTVCGVMNLLPAAAHTQFVMVEPTPFLCNLQ
ncbi:hypothetical protein H257_07344 [Aphanomyces astaci]|uniref:Uncharacterized protein n=1 Tax=Aphanomyces astaci TaxID=112090 RepID=W4GIZ4_APHAT|nr:hypothetical protein H257_07344 [Aphanomyces astaci]ETV79291.1 hypothetical protein H257_07344 [Aphanomyces astaci]|eukprot:XP_009831132.1 hypothetical protein H257_07344 [Aphanomyces astaci]